MVNCCKYCGHPVPDKSVLSVLTPLQKRVFEAIQRAGSAGIPSSQLMDVVYQHDPTGGPDSNNIIAVVARQMRERIAPFGLILRAKRGRTGFYVLEKIGGNDAANG